MKDSIIISLPSHPKYLCVVRSVTDKMGELFGINPTEIEDIKHAVDEACSNVIKYAYSGETNQKIIVKYKFTKKGFEVIIEDTGIKTPLESIKGRNLDDVRPGGLGMHLIKKAFDVFAFDEKRKNGNQLRLIKYRKDSRRRNED